MPPQTPTFHPASGWRIDRAVTRRIRKFRCADGHDRMHLPMTVYLRGRVVGGDAGLWLSVPEARSLVGELARALALGAEEMPVRRPRAGR
ncbi:hypothetical protein G3I34_04995 [Streptomyces sp. SID8014]|uniref:hypothetical protein n=1 Tax=Streptomyces sp. SID8014 TaxID=2706097 RepID=UPI0013B841F9|nr:hypothetical protein [Streptomyces sp. SID8014]NEC11675.1 hypothetical protein [Streptomyces sp. SID8014]